jgi:hypothetical protein
MPPAPEVHIGDLVPLRSVGFGHTYREEVRYSGTTKAPQKDRSNTGEELRIDRRAHARGLGVHAPCAVMYALRPEYQRFVALVGADENLIKASNGSNLAKYPSVVFRVFIDGRQVATSPVMRILSPAWRFDIEIPEGSRMINLVTMDSGDGSREDFADWVNAGFVLKK